MLIAIIFYVYGVLGVVLFKENDPFHFPNIPIAFETLSRWVGVIGGGKRVVHMLVVIVVVMLRMSCFCNARALVEYNKTLLFNATQC